MILSRRYVLPIILALSFSVQSANAIIMNSESLQTDHGFIKWEQLIKMPAQIRLLQFLYVGTIAAVAGVYAYYKTQELNNEPASQEAKPAQEVVAK